MSTKPVSTRLCAYFSALQVENAGLLRNHLEGICNYALYHITTGKVEGTNNMIRTLRRRHYGIPDDDYLFLKIIDESRR
ncbi:transposase [Succinimonas amylolytica]|uniref:transposase n=1 Tax=Succinimonas amylolytica TaxID=83769 RepID=UPI0014615B8E